MLQWAWSGDFAFVTGLGARDRIDVLFNNVGYSDGDSGLMREQRSGKIANFSSIISICSDVSVKGSAEDSRQGEGQIAYKVSNNLPGTGLAQVVINACYFLSMNSIVVPPQMTAFASYLAELKASVNCCLNTG